MTALRLERVATLGDCTLGRVFDVHSRHIVCYTAERRWNNNTISKSCIPAGCYEVRPYLSGRFGKCFAFDDEQTTPRTAIRWHAGNVPHRDSTGCILPGKAYGLLMQEPAVLHSRAALNGLLQAYPDGFTLHIEGVG